MIFVTARLIAFSTPAFQFASLFLFIIKPYYYSIIIIVVVVDIKEIICIRKIRINIMQCTRENVCVSVCVCVCARARVPVCGCV